MRSSTSTSTTKLLVEELGLGRTNCFRNSQQLGLEHLDYYVLRDGIFRDRILVSFGLSPCTFIELIQRIVLLFSSFLFHLAPSTFQRRRLRNTVNSHFFSILSPAVFMGTSLPSRKFSRVGEESSSSRLP